MTSVDDVAWDLRLGGGKMRARSRRSDGSNAVTERPGGGAAPVAASDETRRGALPTPAAPVTYPPPNLIPCSVRSGRDVRRIRGIRSWFISLIYKWHVALSRAKMISLLRQARQMNGPFLVSKNVIMVQNYYSRAGAYSLSQITMSTDSRGICCVRGAVNSFLQLGEIWTMVLKFVKELASMHLFPQTGLINALKLFFLQLSKCQQIMCWSLI